MEAEFAVNEVCVERKVFSDNESVLMPFRFVQWHPKFNVYVVNDDDVLLVSSEQQWLLHSSQFPFFIVIDGMISVERIKHFIGAKVPPISMSHAVSDFVKQIHQFVSQGLLLIDEPAPVYCQPHFNNDQSNGEYREVVSNLVQLVNLSILPEPIVFEWLSGFREALKQCSKLNDMDMSIVLVDDMLDPRIIDVAKSQSFLVLQINPHRIWLSPCFTCHERDYFLRFQRRLLANQPIRQWLIKTRPNGNHAYPILAEILSHNFSGKPDTFISTVIFKIVYSLQQQIEMDDDQLLVYHPLSDALESHPINPELREGGQYYSDLLTPIHLTSQATCTDVEGGLRVVTAQQTLEKLMPLISPITGVVNHLTLLEKSTDKPIHVYRTGFFRAPNHPNINSQERFVQICLGKGVCIEQSKASGLSEAIERFCAVYQDELPLFKCSAMGLRAARLRYIDFQQLAPLSESQYGSFLITDHALPQHQHGVIPYDGRAVHWLPSWSLTQGEWVYFPMSLGVSQLPFDEPKFGQWHSNGCAAGNTLEEAILQGLFELIERDAVAIWWYNQLCRPEFPLCEIEGARLDRIRATLSSNDVDEKAQLKDEADYDFWVLNLTHDLGVPVMAAIGKHKVSGTFIMGFGCHLLPDVAAERALTELCQLQLIAHRHSAPFDFNAINDSTFLYPQASNLRNAYLQKNREKKMLTYDAESGLKSAIERLVSRFKALHFEVCVFNYSQTAIPLKTVKVLVPGLCHIWPQLANKRLYQLPVTLGWMETALDETSINQHWLYI